MFGTGKAHTAVGTLHSTLLIFSGRTTSSVKSYFISRDVPLSSQLALPKQVKILKWNVVLWAVTYVKWKSRWFWTIAIMLRSFGLCPWKKWVKITICTLHAENHHQMKLIFFKKKKMSLHGGEKLRGSMSFYQTRWPIKTKVVLIGFGGALQGRNSLAIAPWWMWHFTPLTFLFLEAPLVPGERL